ncbi:MAG: ankyrin repeat domain-containing protein [Synergistaceae bacterium]|nr:ankyrin repeat domain-containing protein [Synergistaceae bacterium]
MKKLYIIALLFLYLVIPAQAAEELKDYLVKGMPDYELTVQTRNYNQLIINSLEVESKEVVKTPHEGNLVYSRYDFRGDKSVTPSNLQILRYYMTAVSKLGGEVLWEDASNFHASFARGGKQYYMTIWTNASSYEMNVLEAADLKYDMEILDADYVFGGIEEYELVNQARKFDQLTIYSTQKESRETETTVHEGNLVYSRYDYKGGEVTRPSIMQILRCHQLAVAKLGGEVLWEDGSNFHASFSRGGGQRFMTIWTNASCYEIYILEVADLKYDVELLLDDEEFTKEEQTKEEKIIKKEEKIIEIEADEVPGDTKVTAAEPWVGLWRNADMSGVSLYSLNADGTFEFRVFHLDGKKDILTGKYKVADGKINMTDRIYDGQNVGDATYSFMVDGDALAIDLEACRRVRENDRASLLADPTAPYDPGGIDAAAEHYILGNDKIPSVMKVVGKRNIVNYNTGIFDGVTMTAVTYWTDPADETQSANDVAKYFQYLLSNDGFISLKAFSGLPYEGGVEMSFARNSVDDGNIVIVDISYNTKGYRLVFRKGEGKLSMPAPAVVNPEEKKDELEQPEGKHEAQDEREQPEVRTTESDQQKDVTTIAAPQEKQLEATAPQPADAMSAKEFQNLCITGTYEQIEAAIKAGADVNAKNDVGSTALIMAAVNNSAEVISALVEAGSDVHAKNSDGSTALIMAAAFNSAEVVNALVKAGSDVNAKDNDDWTALMVAARDNENPEIIQVLLKNGADKQAVNKEGKRAIDYAKENENLKNTDVLKELEEKTGDGENAAPAGAAMSTDDFLELCKSGTVQQIEAAIKAGADVNAKNDDGLTALMAAALKNNAEATKMLIKAGADVNAKDNEDWTALMAATLENSAEVTNALIKAGADVNARNDEDLTVLMIAVDYSGTTVGSRGAEVVNALIQAGANVNAKSNDGKTALSFAVKRYSDIVSLLLANGADVSENDVKLAQENYLVLGRDIIGELEEAVATSVVLQKIEAEIKNGMDVNAKEDDGSTVLMKAIKENANSKIINALIQAGADINAKDNEGMTPFMWAASKNKFPEVLSVLIQAGADVNAKNEYGGTPLMTAAATNSAEVINALVAAGADVNAKSNSGLSPLIMGAAFNENPEVLTALLQVGSDVNEKDNDGWTPLLAAALRVNHEFLYPLFKAGAYVNAKNSDGATALMVAAQRNYNPKVISVLLENGADAQAKDNEGKRAIDYLRENENLKNTDALKELEEKTGDGINAAPAGAAMSVDDFLKLCRSGTPQQIEAAIKSGMDANEKNIYGVTPLIVAAEYNKNPEVLNALIRGGADVNVKLSGNNTALMMAVWHNSNPEVVNALIQARADVNAKNDGGMTALIWAALENNAEVTKALINAGADVNAKDEKGFTALVVAIDGNDNPAVIRILIQAGADVNVKINDGRTPLNFATKIRAPEIVSLLLAAGATVSENDVELAQKNKHLKGAPIIEELKQRVNK